MQRKKQRRTHLEQGVRLYEGNGLCEQFHSKFKIDLDFERLARGKFVTNVLIVSMAVLVLQHSAPDRPDGIAGRQCSRTPQSQTPANKDSHSRADLSRRPAGKFRTPIETAAEPILSGI